MKLVKNIIAFVALSTVSLTASAEKVCELLTRCAVRDCTGLDAAECENRCDQEVEFESCRDTGGGGRDIGGGDLGNGDRWLQEIPAPRPEIPQPDLEEAPF